MPARKTSSGCVHTQTQTRKSGFFSFIYGGEKEIKIQMNACRLAALESHQNLPIYLLLFQNTQLQNLESFVRLQVARFSFAHCRHTRCTQQMQEHKQMQQPSRTRRDNAERRPLKARGSAGPPATNEPRCGGTQTGRTNARTIMQSVHEIIGIRLCERATSGAHHTAH